jgi:hypothetical protein
MAIASDAESERGPRALGPRQSASMGEQTMVILLVTMSCLGALMGLVLLSKATSGVGVLCVGCLLAIFARIAQASAQHAELKKLIDKKPQGDAA